MFVVLKLTCCFISDEEPHHAALDNLPPEVTSEDRDLYKQVREKALQV